MKKALKNPNVEFHNDDAGNLVVDPSSSSLPNLRRRTNIPSESGIPSSLNATQKPVTSNKTIDPSSLNATQQTVTSNKTIDPSEFAELFANEENAEKWWTIRIPWLCGETDILIWGLGRVLFLLIGVYFLIRNYLSSRADFIKQGIEMNLNEHNAL
jgi:hypothetical protein